MRLESYRSPELTRRLAGRIAVLAREAGRDLAVMEVCGTHTMSIARCGLRSLLPENLRLLSGPGCPVCVTAQRDLDRAIAIATQHPVRVVTFGDLFRVPGTQMSLEQAKAAGARIVTAYSPLAALEAARAEPAAQTVFLGIGFETTAPALAATLKRARAEGLGGFSILSLCKLVPPALRAILRSGQARIDGLLLPGHVSVVLGSRPYAFIPAEFGVPCVIAGFEPVDILQGLAMLLEQLREGRAAVEIAYRRAVSPDGNPAARALLAEIFTPCEAEWRALGAIPASGLALAPEYESYDAERRFPVTLPKTAPANGCRCGEILTARAAPRDCPLFGKTCTPGSPVGPCMVSSEGACAAHYLYGGA
jgi:hydrogenase expression/formation protein HypD